MPKSALAREVGLAPLPCRDASQYRRYYEIAGVTVEVRSDLPISDQTFADKFRCFEVDGPGPDSILIHHHFGLPDLSPEQLGREVFRGPRWIIYSQHDSWTYLRVFERPGDPQPYCVAIFDRDYARGDVYHASPESFLRGSLASLMLVYMDEALLAQVFADREGCIMHSSAAVFGAGGLLFVGPSGAGKSTTVQMLNGRAEILCDDRNVIRRRPDGFRVHGTWTHGKIARVSAGEGLLRAILFPQKSIENRLVPLKDSGAIIGRLLTGLIKPLATADWWEKSLALVGAVVREVPCYEMRFDRSGRIVRKLEDLAQSLAESANGSTA
jgi:hypothetical protein